MPRACLLAAVLCLLVAPTARAGTVTGTPAGDRLQGGASDDTLVGLAGDDRLNGGPGNDVLDGGPGNDDMAGGTGTDAVTYAGQAAVRVTIDDLANDGAAGEQDNVQTDIEDVFGGDGADDITGSAAGNTLDGGAGNDTLRGGGGQDSLFGGAGDDRIYARDGVSDTIDCGDGFDSAIVDERDRATGCEAVDRAPAVPRVEFTVSYEWIWTSTFTSATRLRVNDLHPPHARVTVRCTGGGCPVSLHREVAARHANLLGLLGHARLRSGAVLEVRGVRAGNLGRVFRFRFGAGSAPVMTLRCTPAGSRRLRSCPSTG